MGAGCAEAAVFRVVRVRVALSVCEPTGFPGEAEPVGAAVTDVILPLALHPSVLPVPVPWPVAFPSQQGRVLLP